MLRIPLLSAAALSLAFAAPAYAQTAMEGTDMERVKEKMGAAGLEERRDFPGTLFRAMTEDGEMLFMLVSPRELAANGEIEVSEADIRERFEEAGFTNIAAVEEAQFAIGDLDDDKSIIVMRARDMLAEMQIGAPAATGTVAPVPPTDELPGADVPGASPAETPGLPGMTVPEVPDTGTLPETTPGAPGPGGVAPGTAPITPPGTTPGATPGTAPAPTNPGSLPGAGGTIQ